MTVKANQSRDTGETVRIDRDGEVFRLVPERKRIPIGPAPPRLWVVSEPESLPEFSPSAWKPDDLLGHGSDQGSPFYPSIPSLVYSPTAALELTLLPEMGRINEDPGLFLTYRREISVLNLKLKGGPGTGKPQTTIDMRSGRIRRQLRVWEAATLWRISFFS